MNSKTIYQIIVLVALVALAWFLLPHVHQPQTQPTVNVTDFASCQQAGGALTDGDPVTCSYNGHTYSESQSTQPEVMLDTPQYGDLVHSPMTVSGKARGNWFFEANLPVVLKDENGKVLAQQGMHATADWMTTDYVPFTGTLTFDPGTAQYGVLIISKDNPSGLPQYDSSVAVPIRFK